MAMPILAAAAGLGGLRGETVLGERLRVEIDIIGADRRYPEASCFRLIRPAGNNDLPWLQTGSLAVRSGNPPVLEIRSTAILRDPVMQLGVQLGCGYEISRDYVVLVMPAAEPRTAISAPDTVAPAPSAEQPPRRVVRRAVPRDSDSQPMRLAQRQVQLPAPASVDRLMLSGGGDHGDQLLQLATDLASLRTGLKASEAQRDILRLEYRMLMALGEQAATQLATAEKLRNMEATLGDLQARAADFAGRVEQGGAVSLTPEVTPAPAVVPAQPVVPGDSEQGLLSQWSLYGALLGVVLGLAGWLGWRNYEQRRQMREERALPLPAAEPSTVKDGLVPLAPRMHGHGEVDIHFDLPEAQVATRLDLELDGAAEGDSGNRAAVESPRPAPVARNSAISIAEATVDEHFEANPVMELADIMLSFGRVKGAAQALREYIDNNPEEALQPWIRLMDVYRMAGMRDEFEEVARNLNQHFNVEVQHWSDTAAEQPRPESLEEMPRIMKMISDLWWTGDVVGYLYQLLRDNRGGKRAGFALPLVEEILFLIELKETSNRIEKKEESHE